MKRPAPATEWDGVTLADIRHLAAQRSSKELENEDGSPIIVGVDTPSQEQIAAAQDSRCAECGQRFTPAEWEDRHSRDDGEDVHSACCPTCFAEDELMRVSASTNPGGDA